MTDVIDHASGTETKFTEVALAAQLRRSRQAATQESEKFCIECGDEIPQARRELISGCKYCIECQRLAEERTR